MLKEIYKGISVQFTKFCNNIYFNPENLVPQNMEAVKKARKLVIKNFISLTKVFTCSPYDSILLGQAESLKFMDKSNNKAFQNLMNYIINTNSYYNYRNSGIDNLNESLFKGQTFKTVYEIVLLIVFIQKKIYQNQ